VIRSTKHQLKFTNPGKISELSRFLDEYHRVGQLIIDEIWTNGYEKFSTQNDTLNLPKYLDYKRFRVETLLSARALSSLVCQVSGKIRAATKKRSQVKFVIQKLRGQGKNVDKLVGILNTKHRLVKPTMGLGAELSSKCVDIVENKTFGWFLRVKSTGFKPIKLPISNHERSKFWLSKGKMLGSFLIRKGTVEIRYEVKPQKTSGTEKVAIDQGIKTVATISNGSKTPDTCIHGHSFDSICDKLSRKKKGSKSFGQAQSHRKNFINWSLNQICWDTFAEVKLEKIVNIGFGKCRKRKLQHFTNTLIRDKIKKCCEEREVPVIEQDSSYRSQRCSKCGIVRKSNRKGKIYSCKHCGFVCDADLNAAKNHTVDIPDAEGLRGQKLNLGNGFYWKSSGFWTFNGQEIRVPDSTQKAIL
jgi:transposase